MSLGACPPCPAEPLSSRGARWWWQDPGPHCSPGRDAQAASFLRHDANGQGLGANNALVEMAAAKQSQILHPLVCSER